MAPKAEERYFCKHRSRSLYWFRRLPSPLLLCRSVSINTRHDFLPSRNEAPVLSRYERLPPLLLLARFRRRGGDTVCTTTARKVLRRGQRTRLSPTGRSRPRRGPRRSLSWRRRRSEKWLLMRTPLPRLVAFLAEQHKFAQPMHNSPAFLWLGTSRFCERGGGACFPAQLWCSAQRMRLRQAMRFASG